MSRLYLLDTNILSDLVRNPKGRIRDEIARAGAKSVATSIVVAAELRYGAAKKNSPRLSAQVETILASIDILPLEPPADEIYGFIRADLERLGVSIGQYDLLIAARRPPRTSLSSRTMSGSFRARRASVWKIG